MEKICSRNFVSIFRSFENRLNAIFQRDTKLLEGGNVRIPKGRGPLRYRKKLVSKEDVTIEISVFYDKIEDDYLYYSYNIFWHWFSSMG